MDRNFLRALALVLKHEGGFVNHPDDPGGATNRGITIATFRRYVKKNGTVADLKAISPAQVAQVYRKHYWDAVRGDELPDGVDYAVFDFAVNSGPGRAARYLQDVAGVRQDGAIGPQTLNAVKSMDADGIISELCENRMRFLQGLPTWRTFGKGWTGRVDGVERDALAMAGHRPGNPPKPSAPVSGGFWSAIAAFFKAFIRGGK